MFNSILKKHYGLDFGSMLGGAASGAMAGGPVGAGIGLVSSLIPQLLNMGTARKQRLESLHQQGMADSNFSQASDFANQGLNQAKGNYATAQNAYNGRMAGAGAMEQNIYGNQANTLAAMGRNASSGAQLLALAGGVQGNTNNAFGGLATQEAQNKMYSQQMLDFANQGVMGALGNAQNLKYNQGSMHQNMAAHIGEAGQVNQANAVNGIGNAAVQFGPGIANGIGSMFGQNPGNASQQPQINLSLPTPNGINSTGYNFLQQPSTGYNFLQQAGNPQNPMQNPQFWYH